MRYRLLLAAGLCLSLSGSAAAHTSVGGGSSGPEDPNADCLRWEVVPLTVDGGVADGSGRRCGPQRRRLGGRHRPALRGARDDVRVRLRPRQDAERG